MPGKIHYHNGIEVYHRIDGALVFHKMRHSRILSGLDRKRHAENRPEKAGYPQSGDGRPMHQGHDRKIVGSPMPKKKKKVSRR